MRWLFLLFALASCGFPNDIDGASERIAARHEIRVGVDAPSAAAEPFLARLQRATGARLTFRRAPLEHLVEELNNDRLDVIVAAVRSDALLADEIALSPALEGKAAEERPIALRAAVRNGENRWLMTVERVARGDGK